MSSLIGKANLLLSILKQNGGIRGSIVQLFRTDELKDGKLIGEDYLGNKYFENDRYFLGRNRWVVYGNRFGWDYEGSQVPPEWHRWLHYMGDENPISQPPKRELWMTDHKENTTMDSADKWLVKQFICHHRRIKQWLPMLLRMKKKKSQGLS